MLSELIDEIEDRLRLIIREDLRAALLESKNPSFWEENPIENEKTKPSTQKDFPELLTAPQVAEILGVNVQRVYELTRQRKINKLPVIVIGERSYR